MMNLHLDSNAFRVLIDHIHERTGFRTDVLEKDYYVVLILKELSELQHDGLAAYFKGGTALYKALKTTNRFSEDIDLSVETRGCNRTQSDKRLEKASKKYTVLPLDSEKGFTHRSEVMAVYNYVPITEFDQEDALQRFGNVKVEATSFTISEPVEDIEISAMLYEYATSAEQDIMRRQYGMEPFSVKTITLERIFVDKLFAAEAYVRKSNEAKRAFEAAKHIYDLAILKTHPKIQTLLADEDQLKYLIEIRMREEVDRHDGVPYLAPAQFVFFDNAETDTNVRAAYEIMQRQYVLRTEDQIQYADAISALKSIREKLLKNPAWMQSTPPQGLLAGEENP